MFEASHVLFGLVVRNKLRNPCAVVVSLIGHSPVRATLKEARDVFASEASKEKKTFQTAAEWQQPQWARVRRVAVTAKLHIGHFPPLVNGSCLSSL